MHNAIDSFERSGVDRPGVGIPRHGVGPRRDSRRAHRANRVMAGAVERRDSAEPMNPLEPVTSTSTTAPLVDRCIER